jgi:hypothetical protein
MTAEFEKSRPPVVGMNPPNGAAGVDPSTEAISFRFSKPMGKGVNVMFDPGGKPAYRDVKSYGWDDTGTLFSLRVSLEPERTYECTLNSEYGGGFQALDGVPAKMYSVKFSTGPPVPR